MNIPQGTQIFASLLKHIVVVHSDQMWRVNTSLGGKEFCGVDYPPPFLAYRVALVFYSPVNSTIYITFL